MDRRHEAAPPRPLHAHARRGRRRPPHSLRGRERGVGTAPLATERAVRGGGGARAPGIHAAAGASITGTRGWSRSVECRMKTKSKGKSQKARVKSNTGLRLEHVGQVQACPGREQLRSARGRSPVERMSPRGSLPANFCLLTFAFCLLTCFFFPTPAYPQQSLTFRGRRSWLLQNDKLRVTALPGGGHIAELVLKSPPSGREVNPLWIPPWPSIEPSTYTRDRHGPIYGTDSDAATLSGIMGHNVCFDYWGAPSHDEFKAGLSYHGEVSTLAWREVNSRAAGGAVDFTYRADLPEGRTSLTRTLRLRPGQPVL